MVLDIRRDGYATFTRANYPKKETWTGPIVRWELIEDTSGIVCSAKLWIAPQCKKQLMLELQTPIRDAKAFSMRINGQLFLKSDTHNSGHQTRSSRSGDSGIHVKDIQLTNQSRQDTPTTSSGHDWLSMAPPHLKMGDESSSVDHSRLPMHDPEMDAPAFQEDFDEEAAIERRLAELADATKDDDEREVIDFVKYSTKGIPLATAEPPGE